MRPIIAIPSYKRPNGIAIQRLKNIPLDKYLFIRTEEYEIYKLVARENGFKIVKLKNVTDLGTTRQKLVQYCNNKGFDWVFMFDDDIQKVELLGYRKDKQRWDSQRIISGSKSSPRFEIKALNHWYKLAKRFGLSLSSPCPRYCIGQKGSSLHINSHPAIQCVLLHIPDLISVGNYKSVHITGVEDYYIQFKLMEAGFKTGVINSIEYDCPSVGNCNDGSDQNKVEKYQRYIQAFFDNVCNDPRYITTKTTRTGFPSLNFVWKNFNPEKLNLEDL